MWEPLAVAMLSCCEACVEVVLLESSKPVLPWIKHSAGQDHTVQKKVR